MFHQLLGILTGFYKLLEAQLPAAISDAAVRIIIAAVSESIFRYTPFSASYVLVDQHSEWLSSKKIMFFFLFRRRLL